MLRYSLPDLYHELFPREILQSRLQETKATCEACNWKAYDPGLKCCTYEPYLPNYLVGAILQSQSTASSAREAVLQKIAKRRYALPIGLTASVRYQVNFNNRKDSDFGNREDWLCPYYNHELQNCGIWKYRGAVCTTFYCQSSYGKKGLQFWKRLNDYLTYVEMALMEEVLVYLDFSPRQISDQLQFLNRKEGSATEMKALNLPEAKARKLWNGYFDEQEEFYRKSYEMVRDFDKPRFREALGEMGAELEKQLMQELRILK